MLMISWLIYNEVVSVSMTINNYGKVVIINCNINDNINDNIKGYINGNIIGNINDNINDNIKGNIKGNINDHNINYGNF